MAAKLTIKRARGIIKKRANAALREAGIKIISYKTCELQTKTCASAEYVTADRVVSMLSETIRRTAGFKIGIIHLGNRECAVTVYTTKKRITKDRALAMIAATKEPSFWAARTAGLLTKCEINNHAFRFA